MSKLKRAPSRKKCTLCQKLVHRIEVTGTKLMEGKKAGYQLCVTCCRQLHGLSLHSATELKKRKEFWEEVWAKLA